METLIIESNAHALNPVAAEYLKEHSTRPFTLHKDTNVRRTIIKGYQRGVRQFLLALYNDQIVEVMDLIQEYTDAKFAAPLSLDDTTRGKYPNLYFSIPTSNQYLNLIANYFEPVRALTAVIYDVINDPIIGQGMTVLEQAGYLIFQVDNLDWQEYHNLLILVTAGNTNAWTVINANVVSTQKYTLYSIFAAVPPPMEFSSSLDAIIISMPSATTTVQMNSYWNVITKDSHFNHCEPWFSVYPLLINQDWDLLLEQNLLSTHFFHNGFYFGRDRNYFKVTLNPNRKNEYLTDGDYIWVIDQRYFNQYTKENLKYIKKHNPKVTKIHATSDVARKVKQYWDQGHRRFILEAPSLAIKQIQKLNLKYDSQTVFICTRATSPKIRWSGSPFFFTLTDDTNMMQSYIAGSRNATTTCILGSSDNINIKLFRSTLDQLKVPRVNINQLGKINPDTLILYTVGNDRDYEAVLSYLEKHQLSALTSLRKYGGYITEEQLERVQKLNLSGTTTLINLNSCQPLLESEYSQISRPFYLSESTYFLDLANILLVYPLKFLFDFGYIIDA